MSLKQDFNYMKNIMKTPCHNGTVALYAEAGIRAVGTAAWDLLSFGCREPLKHAAGRGQFAEWFGNANRRGTGFGHRRPKGSKGKSIPALTRAGQSFFWGFEALAERTLFLWFLAELGKEAAMNWTSLVYAELGCDGPAAGHCVFQVTPQPCGANPTELLIFPEPDCHGVFSDLRSFHIPAGLQAQVMYHVQSVPWPPQPDPGASLNTRLFSTDTGEAWGASDWNNSQGTGNGTTGVGRHISGGLGGSKRISLVGQSGGGIAWITGGQIHVTLTGRAVPLVSMTDCFKPKKGSEFDKALDGLWK